MAHLRRHAGRILLALALLVAWIGVQAQSGDVTVGDLGARALAARLLLCYVAAFWLRLAWDGLTSRAAPTGTAPAAPGRPAETPATD
jgi:hypothetical protein